MKIFVGILLVVIVCQLAEAFDTKLPYTELLRCKEYRAKGKYSYNFKKVFDIHKMENNRPEYGELFRLKFYVLASNGKDAWILLRTNTNQKVDQLEIGKKV